jgi:hypothetical protein
MQTMSTIGKIRIGFFAGPSLRATEIHAACAGLQAEVCVWPPIQQGDLLRRKNELPDIVAILDGYFQQVPAVLHKEILFALENGVRVLGAASLGALRAAELDVYGMEGVGEVYRLYKEGEIDGDDEVAILHAHQEDGFRPLTEPLVNIRYNLARARKGGILTAQTSAALLRIAKRFHYTERTYEAVLRAANPSLASPDELRSLRDFLQMEAVDLKRQDALALVHLVAARVWGNDAWPPRVPFQHQKTKYFHILARDYVGYTFKGRPVPQRMVLACYKLLSRSFPDVFRRVTLRCLALEEAYHRGLVVENVESLLPYFRSTHGLLSESAYQAWLAGHYLTEQELFLILHENALEALLLEAYRAKSPPLADAPVLEARLLADVVARTGLRETELAGPLFMQPGILWEEPLIREIKWRGAFGLALETAGRVLALESQLFEGKPELKSVFEALLSHAGTHLETWIARRWGIARSDLEDSLRKRGFLRYREFLETARLVYVYEKHGPGPLFFEL